MAELLSISILETKRNEIEDHVAAPERQIDQARTDLLHLNATLRLFDLDGSAKPKVYVNLSRMFARGEMMTLAKAYLATMPDGVADTRQIAAQIMQAKGWDATDKPLTLSVTNRVTHMLKAAERTGRFKKVGKRDGANLWRVTG